MKSKLGDKVLATFARFPSEFSTLDQISVVATPPKRMSRGTTKYACLVIADFTSIHKELTWLTTIFSIPIKLGTTQTSAALITK